LFLAGAGSFKNKQKQLVCSAAWYFKDALKRCIEYFPFQLHII